MNEAAAATSTSNPSATANDLCLLAGGSRADIPRWTCAYGRLDVFENLSPPIMLTSSSKEGPLITTHIGPPQSGPARSGVRSALRTDSPLAYARR